MPQSATCSYWAGQAGSVYNYEVTLSNTSDEAYDIYSFIFGGQYEVPITQPYPFKDVVVISSPPGWGGAGSYDGVSFGGGQGSYIPPGQSGTFTFQSSTPPGPETVFGCGYYNNANTWGFNTNGTAERQQLAHKSAYYVHINPLVLLLGDALFARLNLPRPPFDGPSFRSQLAAGIRSMTASQRDVAARTLEAYVAALTEVRKALTHEGRV